VSRTTSCDILAAGLLDGDAMIGVSGEVRRAKHDGFQVERNKLGKETACKEDSSPVSATRCPCEVIGVFDIRGSSKEVGGEPDRGGCGSEGTFSDIRSKEPAWICENIVGETKMNIDGN